MSISIFRKTIILLFLAFVACSVSGQEKKERIRIALNSGVQLGWWVYNRGSLDPTTANTEGIDNSHLSFYFPLELNVSYHLKKLRFGVGSSFYLYYDKNMIKQFYGRASHYPIAKSHVDILDVHINTGWELFSNNFWTIAPSLKYGTFWIKTLHPEQENFGLKTHWEVGINQEFKLGKTILLLQPIYRKGKIIPKEKISPQHKHQLFAFGVNFGLIYTL